jgi:hypothetical protein
MTSLSSKGKKLSKEKKEKKKGKSLKAKKCKAEKTLNKKMTTKLKKDSKTEEITE